jgi:hypothetical protein
MALTGWLARREREVVVYLIEKTVACTARGWAGPRNFLPAGGVIVASAENWNTTVSDSDAQRAESWNTTRTIPTVNDQLSRDGVLSRDRI